MRQRTTVVTRELPQQQQQAAGRGLFGQVDELLNTDGPLDEQEQAKLIEDFEEIQLKQARTWRAFFGVIALLLCTLFAWSAWSEHLHPWELRHVGEFQSVLQHGPALAVLVMQAAALGACSLGMFIHIPARGDTQRGCMPAPTQQKAALLLSLLLSILGAAFWGHQMMRMHARHGKAGDKWELCWVPLAPLLCSVMCLFVSSSLDRTAGEVTRLRTLRYQHRKV